MKNLMNYVSNLVWNLMKLYVSDIYFLYMWSINSFFRGLLYFIIVTLMVRHKVEHLWVMVIPMSCIKGLNSGS